MVVENLILVGKKWELRPGHRICAVVAIPWEAVRDDGLYCTQMSQRPLKRRITLCL